MEVYTKKNHIVLVLCNLLAIVLSISTLSGKGYCAQTDANGISDCESFDYESFYSCLEKRDYAQSASVGDSIFMQLEQQYDSVGAFSLIKRKLATAASLGQQMEVLLKRETEHQMWAAVDLFSERNKRKKTRLPSVPPAKTFYEKYVGLFSGSVTAGELDKKTQDFLKAYYNLKLKLHADTIAKAGRGLAIADPGFDGTHSSVLVLPLLHAFENTALSVQMVPEWMRHPLQLEMLSDSCLLHFGFPFHAMTLSKHSAKVRHSTFSEFDFYRRSAKKCLKTSPHTAIKCLQRAVDAALSEDANNIMTVRLELVQKCLDIGNYALAAIQARKLLDADPNNQDFGRFVWLYFYSLSQSNNVERILADIDDAIEDKRCEPYKTRLLYTKWWALRHKPQESARAAALEHKMLQQYAQHPLVAQILLYRAENLLSKQQRDPAYELLNEILNRFPSTNAAAKARKVLAENANKTN